jgi:hypothetical protein
MPASTPAPTSIAQIEDRQISFNIVLDFVFASGIVAGILLLCIPHISLAVGHSYSVV